jgi:hypothetical protein
MPMRVALVSCVKSKLDHPAPARDLYTSALFRALRGYAETHADAWFILSAEHGLVDPHEVLAPYERTLNRMGKSQRQEWATRVKAELASRVPAGAEVIILAGQRYREDLIPFLRDRGHSVAIPLEGLPLGRQLQRLKELRSPR